MTGRDRDASRRTTASGSPRTPRPGCSRRSSGAARCSTSASTRCRSPRSCSARRRASSRWRDPAFTGVDAQTSILLGYESGAHAVLTCTLRAQSPTRAAIVGTEGRIEIEGAFYAPAAFTLILRGGETQRFDIRLRGAAAPRGRRGRALLRGRAAREPADAARRDRRDHADDGRRQSFSRCLTTLPIALRGSSSRKRTSRGRLCGASCRPRGRSGPCVRRRGRRRRRPTR